MGCCFSHPSLGWQERNTGVSPLRCASVEMTRFVGGTVEMTRFVGGTVERTRFVEGTDEGTRLGTLRSRLLRLEAVLRGGRGGGCGCLLYRGGPARRGG